MIKFISVIHVYRKIKFKNEKVQILFLSHTLKLHFLSISLGRT
jgi:hypothetical protein